MNDIDVNIIKRYFANECSEAEIEMLFEWINASESNRREWLKLRIVSARNVFSHFSNPEHIDRSFKELLEKQDALRRIEQKITRKITLRFMRYAASVLVVVGLSAFCYMYVVDWLRPDMVVVLCETDNVKQIMLEDNTQVWLSAGSRIEYPERFGKKERKVLVEGKVFFETAKDTNRPFLVETETYTVKVLGTEFEVNAFKYSQTSDVTLVDGKVEILDNNRATLCTLQPGQQFKIDKISNSFILQQVQAKMYTSWHGGTLEFDGLTFAEIVKILEHHYNVRIITEEGIDKDQKLVGSLSLQKNIYQMMKALELVVPIKYQVQTDTIVTIQAQK